MRILEFVEDSYGKLSTPSLVVIVGTFVLSLQILIDAVTENTNEIVIGIYATLITSVYGVKKAYDTSIEKTSIKAEAAKDAQQPNS